MFKKIKNLIGFLTIIPMGMDPDRLTDAADYMYLFPLVGALIGLLGGAFSWLLLDFLPNSVRGILTLGLILFLTNLHHIDGLMDFGDGLMYPGSAEEKIKILHDPQAGTGGVILGMIVIMATGFSIVQLNPNFIISSLIVSEASAKLSMVFMAWAGRSGHKGVNTLFIDVMHDKYRHIRLATSLLIAFVIAAFLLNIKGIIAVLASLAVTLGLILVSNKHFKGVTGDVFGAGNEITRLASLISILMVIP